MVQKRSASVQNTLHIVCKTALSGVWRMSREQVMLVAVNYLNVLSKEDDIFFVNL